MLKISHLSKSFGSRKILDDISCEIAPREVALLLGASGSGKSTLLRILNNLESKDSGSITLDGKELDLARVNQTHVVGMVFQQFNLFEHMTVLQNITFPLERALDMAPAEAERIARDMLRKYNLLDKAQEYATNLSGGQKQRLALARTLALKPRIVCLDEPTSALDPLLTNYVAHAIEDLALQGYLVMVASHDTQLIEKLSCRIYLLEQGRVVEQASSSEYKAHPQQFPRINAFIHGHDY